VTTLRGRGMASADSAVKGTREPVIETRCLSARNGDLFYNQLLSRNIAQNHLPRPPHIYIDHITLAEYLAK